VPVVVALNRFSKDTQREIDLVIEVAKQNGAFDAVLCENYAKGGEGCRDLADAIIRASTNDEEQGKFKYLYDVKMDIVEKIRTIAQQIYSAKDIELSELAKSKIKLFIELVSLPMCLLFRFLLSK
jgi:monofunctional C1-tetrahydrofolate synthase, mitochondrial